MNAELLAEQYTFLAKKFQGKRVMVSGATGLIGSHVITHIDNLNNRNQANIRVVVLYRSDEKRYKLEENLNKLSHVDFVKCNVEDSLPYNYDVDYIIHCAGFSGGSKMHLKDPIKVFDTGINGTRNLLDFAVSHNTEGFLYVSTYEVYGDNSREERITETQACQLDTFISRNSYAEIKRLCESLLCAFSNKYGIKTYSARMTSTFGSGVDSNDPRFFAEFARCVLDGKDILLRSHGRTVRSYLDADDAAIAFFYILANGENCNVYNLTNMNNEISIKDIATRLIELSGARTKLVFDIPEDAHELGLRQEGKMVMDATKLERIGWKPVWELDDTLIKLIQSVKKSM